MDGRDQLSIESSQAFSYDANIGNGASLGWHWNNPTTVQGDQWDLTLPNGGYENFILTEAVPLVSQLDWGTRTAIRIACAVLLTSTILIFSIIYMKRGIVSLVEMAVHRVLEELLAVEIQKVSFLGEID